MFFYRAYGLSIRSDFPLFELLEGGKGEDICIRKDAVKAPQLEARAIQYKKTEILFGKDEKGSYLQWSGILTLLAQNGNTLIVDLHTAEIDPQLLSLYLVSDPLGLLLYQRGFLLLHGSAVKVQDQVIVFLGVSGAGKSTMAAAFNKANYTILADDMVGVIFDLTGRPMVVPAFPQLRLWPQAIKELGYKISSSSPMFVGSRKRVIRKTENFPILPIPLAHIFILGNQSKVNIIKMKKPNAFSALISHCLTLSGLSQEIELQKIFHQSIRLLKTVNISKLVYPKKFSIFEKLIIEIEKLIL